MKTIVLPLFFFFSLTAIAQKDETSDRKLWLTYMDRIAKPVFENLANGTLKKNVCRTEKKSG